MNLSLTVNTQVELTKEQRREAFFKILEYRFGFVSSYIVHDGYVWGEREQRNGSFQKYQIREARPIDEALYTVIKNYETP